MGEKRNMICVLKILEDFAEGKIESKNFWEEYKCNIHLQNLLINDKTRPLGVYTFNQEIGKPIYDKNKPTDSINYFAPERLLQVLDISKLEHRYELFEIVRKFFVRKKINLHFFNEDAENYMFLLKMLPEWLNIRDEIFLKSVLDAAPGNLTKNEKLNYCREKIKKLFKYDKEPPEWIQNPEWPIVNNKPLVFNRQESNIENGYTYYYFYDEETKIETIIEQYD